MQQLRRFTVKAVSLLISIELVYLVLVNGVLRLPMTQDLVNMVRPEKFHVSWDSAWSWYPFRVTAQGISANGQSRSQQWQVEATAASGSISLLPLVLKRVNISNVSATDINYRQRPRLKADKDYSSALEFFPEIKGREVLPADTSVRKKKRPWKVSLQQTRASGRHSYWIYNLKGGGEGTLLADLSIESAGGPFSLNASEIDLHLAPAFLNDSAEVFHRGHVTGRLGFAPFVPRENKGVRMLQFLELDAQLDLDVAGLGFINLFTANLGELEIGGAGKVQGHVSYSQGFMLAGTDVSARAQELSVNIKEMTVSGEGTVRIHTPSDQDVPLGLDIDYDGLTVTRVSDTEPFLDGDGLGLLYSGSNYVLPDPDLDLQELLNDASSRQRRKRATLRMLISEATLLDMSIFNDYLPPDTPLQFTGGTASLKGEVLARVDDLEGGLALASSDLEMELDGQELQGDLTADIVLAGGIPREMKLNFSGSSITLDDVRIAGERKTFDEEYWSAVFYLTSAETVLSQPVELSADARLKFSDTRPLVAMFDNQGKPPRWMSRMLTLRDIEGEAILDINGTQVSIPHAQVISDKAELAAKVVFSPAGRTGVVYARYEKLDVLLKMTGQKSNLDVINVREKYDSYRPPL